MVDKKTKKKRKKNKSNTQKARQEKILRGVLFGGSAIILILVLGYVFIGSLQSSNYDGIEFTTIAEGDLIFYKTTMQTFNEETSTIFNNNIYLRTKISDLKKIDFDRENFNLMKLAVINFTDELSCAGHKSIGVANFNHLHNVLGIELIKDETASCDAEGRYSYYNFMEADKTQIQRVGENCYNVQVASCELLPAIEKIMVEMMLDYNAV